MCRYVVWSEWLIDRLLVVFGAVRRGESHRNFRLLITGRLRGRSGWLLGLGKQVGEFLEEGPTEGHEDHQKHQKGENHAHSDDHELHALVDDVSVHNSELLSVSCTPRGLV